ncbi:hypothetical protein RB653_009813 [Dictyostelium firmibasis]|uniref:ABC transporter domain-containing protein n=1 Tax=Dictyostelium firmibasis TaxID=79012 RepID=A0AAN7TY52_9MYCE
MSVNERILREFLHLKLLLKKNFLVSIRSYFSTIIELLSPIVFVLIFFIIYNYGGRVDYSSKTYQDSLPNCIVSVENRCIDLIFSPMDSPCTVEIMKVLAKNNNMEIYNYPTDTGLIPDMNKTIGFKGGIIGIDSVNSTQQFILAHPNVTLAAVNFLNFPINFTINGVTPNDSLIGVVDRTALSFNVFLNISSNNQFNPPVDYSIEVTTSIQKAIYDYYSVNNNIKQLPTITFDANPFIQFSSINLISLFGGLFYYCGIMISFIFLLYKVAFEKENNLKQGMVMMGLSRSMYWFSWVLTSFTIDLLICLIMIAIGSICKLPFFLGTNFLVLLLNFFLFAISSSSMAFFMVSFIGKTKTAIGIGMAFFIVGSGVQLTFNSMGSIIFQIIYQTDSNGAAFARVILFLLPMFHFSKVLSDINDKIQSYPSSHFTLSDLSENLSGAEYGMDFKIPTTGQSLGFMVVLVVIYLFLSALIEYTISGGFTPKTAKHIDVPHFNDPDVTNATYKALEPSNKSPVIIRGLSKTYTKFLRPSKSVHAIKYLSLDIQKGSVLGLLGSNGAGKTTTIGILTGLHNPTTGDALIYGHSIVKDIDSVRKITSVVPQHDILWLELSAMEHLHLFAELKGVPKSERDFQIAKVLEQVKLTKVANDRCSTFSGGMKRRLSVAMACIGEPKIIFMDEPSTGLDPASKRRIYSLIKDIKKEKVIILTSHDMQEIDVLCDNIVIMDNGYMICNGNSLQLKTKYGEGFSVQVIAKSLEVVGEIVNFVTSSLPNCRFLKQSALQLSFGFPVNTDPKIIVNFFKRLENITKDENNTLMRDWSISHSNMDDVFLKVTQKPKSQ